MFYLVYIILICTTFSISTMSIECYNNSELSDSYYSQSLSTCIILHEILHFEDFRDYTFAFLLF